MQRSGRKWRRKQAQPAAAADVAASAKDVLAAELAAEVAKAKAAAAAVVVEPIELSEFESAEQLLFKGPGPAALKATLASMGLKAGGTPQVLSPHSRTPALPHSTMR